MICCLSFSAEARFGGGGSHSSSHSSSSSHGYSSHGSSKKSMGATIAFLLMAFAAWGGFMVVIVALTESSSDQKEADLPDDVDKQALIKLLRERFMLMQALWDNDDWNQIARYVSPDMIDFLKSRRTATKAKQAPNTVISELSVRIKSYEVNQGETSATVEFKGIDNEGSFTEDWEMKWKGNSWYLVKLIAY